MWIELVKQLGLFGLAVGALTYLAKELIPHLLRASHDKEMERLRSELHLRSIEHEIRFRSIHERQARVLAETYARLYEVHKAVSSYVAILEWSGEPSKDEKLKIVVEAYEKFRTFFFPRKIFLPKAVGDRTMELANKFADIANTFTHGQRREKMARPPKAEEEDHWSKSFEMMSKEIPPLLNQLEEEFQKLLGVACTGGQNG